MKACPPDAGGAAVERGITERIDLEQRLRESQGLLGRLTGGIAHDFNNLLTVIMGNAEMLAHVVTDPRLRRMAETTMSAAQDCAELTSGLMAFARREALDRKCTDVSQLVEVMQGLFRSILPANIRLEVVLEPSRCDAEMDTWELEMALLQIVNRARDAIPGGGKVTVETSNALLDREYADRHPGPVPGDYVLVRVSTSGTGATVTSATVAGANGTRQTGEPVAKTGDVGGGSAVGLDVLLGFVGKAGGHVRIDPGPGGGSVVNLYLPRMS